MRHEAYEGHSPRAHAPARHGLLWTEGWFLAGIAVAVLVTVAPLEWELASDTLVKHLGLLVAAPAIVLTLLGRAARPPQSGGRPVAGPLGVAWPLALLSLLIVAGALYARLALGLQNTFLNFGLYTLLAFGAAAMVVQSDSPRLLLRAHLAMLVAAALVMSASLIVNYGVRQVYHEQIFLVVPMAALFYAGARGTLVRWTGFLFFLAMAWFSHKITAYLVAALTVAYLAVAIELPARLKRGGLAGVAAAYWCVLAALAALALGAIAISGGDDTPSGNLEYRLFTYQAAWERFLDSPLWGNAFTAEAAEKFTLFDTGIAGNVLPTHSDVLDLLANGGILAAALAGFGLLAIAARAWRSLLRPAAAHPLAVYGHVLALSSLSAFLTMAFNPILLQPSMAALVWTNLGLLLGASVRANRERTPPR